MGDFEIDRARVLVSTDGIDIACGVGDFGTKSG